MAERMLWGPWEHGEPPHEPYHMPREDGLKIAELKHDATSNVLERLMERNELDKRAAEYLNLVEAQTAGPASFTAASAATLAAASAPCLQSSASCRRRHLALADGCRAGSLHKQLQKD